MQELDAIRDMGNREVCIWTHKRFAKRQIDAIANSLAVAYLLERGLNRTLNPDWQLERAEYLLRDELAKAVDGVMGGIDAEWEEIVKEGLEECEECEE